MRPDVHHYGDDSPAWLSFAALHCQQRAIRATGTHTLQCPLRAHASHYHPDGLGQLHVIGSAAQLALNLARSAVPDSTKPATQVIHALWPNGTPSALLLASDITECGTWHAIAEQLAIPCWQSDRPAAESLWLLHQALSPSLAPHQSLHATLVVVCGLGVLLTGASGVGKSELALELVSRGHALVADDAVQLQAIGTTALLGRCPPLLHGFLEVRGLGILDLAGIYGAASIRAASRVDLVVDLTSNAPVLDAEQRLHGNRDHIEMLGIQLPRISLAVTARLSAVLIEAACGDHWQRHSSPSGTPSPSGSERMIQRHHATLLDQDAAGDKPMPHAPDHAHFSR